MKIIFFVLLLTILYSCGGSKEEKPESGIAPATKGCEHTPNNNDDIKTHIIKGYRSYVDCGEL